MWADAFVTRDLFRCQPPRHEPEDLDLPIGQWEICPRAVHQDATRR
jgi:hypothetical protein